MHQGEVCRMFELDGMACGHGTVPLRLDGDYLLVTAKGDIDQLRQLVPAPLQATDDVAAYLLSAKETVKDGVTTWAYPFREWGIGVRAKLSEPPYTEGLYLVQSYVDDDFALCGGREQWGYPKKMGQFDIAPLTREEAARYEFGVSRRGWRLVSGNITNLRPIDKEAFPPHGRGVVICYRQIPAPDREAVEKQELVFIQYDVEASDTKGGDGTVSFVDSPFDLIPIGPLGDFKGYFGRVELTAHLAHLVVAAEELARPIEVSRGGKIPVPS
jgi:Acetoacetate decarboxylase (ADC)